MYANIGAGVGVGLVAHSLGVDAVLSMLIGMTVWIIETVADMSEQ